MIRNDFVLRQIEQFGAFMRKLLDAREDGGDAAHSRDLLEGESLSLTGMDLPSLAETPPEALVSRFFMNEAQAAGRMYSSGRLIAELAEIELMEGELTAAVRHYLDSMRLVAFGAAQVDDAEARQGFVDALDELAGRAHRFPLDDAGEAEVMALLDRFREGAA
jgi:hypothetical protein